MAGRGSLSGLFAYGDANAIVMEMAGEVLPVVKNTPVLAGVNGTDPFRLMPQFLKQVKETGFSGVQIGNIISLSGVIGLILGPVLLLISDRTGRHRAALLVVLLAEAVALAGELGQQVGDPYTIQEVQSGWWSGYNAWWGSRWGGGMSQNVIQEIGGASVLADSSVAPGQISVNARVSVTFELE